MDAKTGTQTGVEVELLGEDGNIFNVLGIATKAMKREGYRKEAKELSDKVFKTHSYDDALLTIRDYVEVVG